MPGTNDEIGALLEPLRRGQSVLCLGGELASDGSLRRLIGTLLDRLPGEGEARALLESRPLMAADRVRRRLGPQFAGELRRVTAGAGTSEPLRFLGTLPFSAVVTTSYDPAVEQAFGSGDQPPPVFTPADGDAALANGHARFVLKVLGDPARPETVVWGAADLQAALASGGYRVLGELWKQRSFLLLGFDWTDAELAVLLERILSGVGRSVQPHYAVLPGLSPLERDELLAIYGIHVLDEADPVRLVRGLCEAMADPRRALPAPDDLVGWLARLADEHARPHALERLDAIEQQLRQAGDLERLIELLLGRVPFTPEASLRAALFTEAARLIDEALRDPERAFAARLAAYHQAPSAGAWEALLRSARAAGGEAQAAQAIVLSVPSLPEPDRAEAWAQVAVLRERELGDLDGALAAVDAALALDPGHAGALEQRVVLLSRSGRWRELAETLGRCVLVEESLTRRGELYRALGELYEQHLGDPAQAISCYRLAVEADPWEPRGREALCGLLERRGEFGELVRLLEERAERAPAAEQGGLRRRIATLCEERLGDRRQAIQHWERLRADEPGDREALRALVRLYELEGRGRELLEVLGDAARAESERDRVELLRRAAAEWERQPAGLPRAAESLEALLAIVPEDQAALASLERVYRSAGRFRELAATLERHLVVAPPERRVRLHLELGALHAQPPVDRERAEAAYREVLRLEPGHVEALQSLSRLYEAAGAFERLVALCEERAQLVAGSDRARLLARAGELTGEQLGDPEAAEALFQRALDADARHVPSLVGLAQLFRRQGELQKSARMLVEAADRSANRLERLRLLVEAGESWERLEDPTRALGLYLRVLDEDPEHADAAARACELLWRAERFADLVPILEPLARVDAPQPVQLERLSRLAAAARALDDPERARRAYRRALAIDPGHLESLRGLAHQLLDERAFGEARDVLRTLIARHEPELPPREQVGLYHQLGVCELELGSAALAREHFAHACAIDPTHRPSRLLQLELGEADPLALIEAKKALLATASPEEQVTLHIELGDLYLDRLEDPVQAAGAWEAGLRVQPNESRLLHRLLNVFVEQKAWSQAMDVLTRLLRGSASAATRARYHYTAGMICVEHLGRFSDAADHLWAAVEADPSYKRASAMLYELLRNHKSWKELARYLQFAIQQLGGSASPETRAEQVRLWTELGELHLEKLDDLPSAIVAFEVAARLDPSARRRAKLATIYTGAGPAYHAQAIAEHHALLRDDHARIASYRALKELYEQVDRREHAEACGRALACLNPEGEGPWPTVPLPQATMEPARALTPEHWARLRHPREDQELSALFAAIVPALAAARAQRERQPLQRKRLVTWDDPRPIARALRRAASAFGVPAPATYLQPEQVEAATLTLAVDQSASGEVVTPVLVLGGPLLVPGRDEHELSFEVAQKLARLRPKRVIGYLCGAARDLAHLLDAAVALADEAAGRTPSGELGRTTDALKRGLAPVVLNQVVAAGHRLRGRELAAEARRWLHASHLTCSRAAFLVVGDLESCVRALKAQLPQPTVPLPAAQALDLIWSSVTEDLIAARMHLAG